MQSYGFLEPLAAKMLKKSDLGKEGMNARIVPYFGGNQFYIFYEQTYQDVRLVAIHPITSDSLVAIATTGYGHARADFAMFRIYADKNGEPAAYSEHNVPLKVKKYLPISLKGVDKGNRC